MALVRPTIIERRARDYSSRHGLPVRAIVLHHTAGTNSLSWLLGNANGTSIHYLVRKDGLCYHMVPDEYAAHHVGFSRMTRNGVVYSRKGPYTCNDITLGIEIENRGDGKDPYPEAQLKSVAYLIDMWRTKYGDLEILCHRDIDTQGKTDPRGLTAAQVLAYIEMPQAITDTATLLHEPRSTAQSAMNYIIRRKTDATYTSGDIRLIVGYYWEFGQASGVDPLLAIAQMIHETGNLTSWWSLRPRRNPAGIGVTGASRISILSPGIDWAYNARTARWQHGYSFPTWELAAKAHFGHLLAYCVPDFALNTVQRGLVAADPRASAIPAVLRGTRTTLRDLNGHWATDPVYATKIAQIASSILTQRS